MPKKANNQNATTAERRPAGVFGTRSNGIRFMETVAEFDVAELWELANVHNLLPLGFGYIVVNGAKREGHIVQSLPLELGEDGVAEVIQANPDYPHFAAHLPIG